VLSALFSPKMRCACHFILNEAVPNSALALHWSRKSPARAGPGPRAPLPPPRSSRVAESWSWSRGKWQAAGAISVVGKAVRTLYPPLRPLSHNVNLRDGAQDMLVVIATATDRGVLLAPAHCWVCCRWLLQFSHLPAASACLSQGNTENV
jgi:hypothetical protein